MSAVVDSSVVVVLFTRDPRYAAARRLFEREETLYAPYLLLAEIANALWRVARLGCPPQDIAAIKHFMAAEVPERIVLCEDQNLVADALDIATRLDRSVYDCLFLALAMQRQETLYTFDERFARKLQTSHFAALARVPA